MKYFKLFLVIMAFGLGGCSIQVAGLNGSYKEPITQTKPEIAKLSVTSNDIRIISIDGKSISNNILTLYPGEHKITLYIGTNNYASEVNHMIVIVAKFKANNDYFLKLKLDKAWIENSEGIVVSSVISDMHIKKSVSI